MEDMNLTSMPSIRIQDVIFSLNQHVSDLYKGYFTLICLKTLLLNRINTQVHNRI